MMTFKDVSNINIPQGDISKIYETNGGRVLWSKNFPSTPSAHWEFLDIYDDKAKMNYIEGIERCVEMSDGVEFFIDKDPASYFRYYPDGTIGYVHTLWRGEKNSVR